MGFQDCEKQTVRNTPRHVTSSSRLAAGLRVASDVGLGGDSGRPLQNKKWIGETAARSPRRCRVGGLAPSTAETLEAVALL